jgi:hypothetical protein
LDVDAFSAVFFALGEWSEYDATALEGRTDQVASNPILHGRVLVVQQSKKERKLTIATPLALIKSLSHVAAALIPAGNALTRSAKRTPRGESSRQKPEKLRRGIVPVFLWGGKWGVNQRKGVIERAERVESVEEHR